jgi:hypothetical protein
MAHAFRRLEDLELDAATQDTPLPLGPSDLLHGTLANGMKYVLLDGYEQKVARSTMKTCLGGTWKGISSSWMVLQVAGRTLGNLKSCEIL